MPKTTDNRRKTVRAIREMLREAGVKSLDFVPLQGSLPGITRNGDAFTVDSIRLLGNGRIGAFCTGDGAHLTCGDAGLFTEEELDDLKEHVADYLDNTRDARTMLGRMASLVGKTISLDRLKEALDALSECIGRTVLDGSEGWGHTACPEDYDDEVIFSNDFCPGVENPNMEGCNLYELHYTKTEPQEGDATVRAVINSFDWWL